MCIILAYSYLSVVADNRERGTWHVRILLRIIGWRNILINVRTGSFVHGQEFKQLLLPHMLTPQSLTQKTRANVLRINSHPYHGIADMDRRIAKAPCASSKQFKTTGIIGIIAYSPEPVFFWKDTTSSLTLSKACTPSSPRGSCSRKVT